MGKWTGIEDRVVRAYREKNFTPCAFSTGMKGQPACCALGALSRSSVFEDGGTTKFAGFHLGLEGEESHAFARGFDEALRPVDGAGYFSLQQLDAYKAGHRVGLAVIAAGLYGQL